MVDCRVGASGGRPDDRLVRAAGTKIWKTKSVEDVSLTMFVAFCVGGLVADYGIIRRTGRSSSPRCDARVGLASGDEDKVQVAPSPVPLQRFVVKEGE